MDVETCLIDDDLDDRFPDPDDDGDDDELATAVVTSIVTTDGLRHHAQVVEPGDMTGETAAEALVRVAFAAAGLHSPDAVAALSRRLIKPAETKD